jgi:methylglutaconyl-CoA hydratase
MSYRFLQTRRDGAVEHVTLNRPEVRNAINDEVVAELHTWALRATTSAGLRVVVLAGAGPVFCAGADIAWMQRTLTYTEEANLRDARALTEMLEALNTLPVPLIARVQGAALGGGSGLAAIADIVVATDDALFGFTETRLGILPATIAPYVVAKIGATHARRWFFNGQRFDAATAHAIGLVHRRVPAADLDRAVAEEITHILAAAPGAIAKAKALIASVADQPARDVKELTARTIASQRVSPEGQEGLRAFLEKRKPGWIVEG